MHHRNDVKIVTQRFVIYFNILAYKEKSSLIVLKPHLESVEKTKFFDRPFVVITMMHINDSYIIYSSTSQLVLNEFFIDFNDLVSLESFVEKNTLFSSVAPWRESIVVIFCVHINYIYSLSQ